MSQDKQDQDYSSNYFVPIDRQSLGDIIPHDNQILYSSSLYIHYKITNVNQLPKSNPRAMYWLFRGFGGSSAAGFLAGLTGVMIGKLFDSIILRDLRGSYYTDALFAPEGVALNLPTFEYKEKKNRYKKQAPSPHFIFWNDISLRKNGEMYIYSIFESKFNFLHEFETEENFNNRLTNFYDYILNIREAYTMECIKNAQSALGMGDKGSALEWIERGLKSNVFRSELDHIEELSSLKGEIKKEERDQKLALVEEVDNYIVNYLRKNTGKAFTPESMMKRIVNELDNREWKQYLAENLNGVLTKLLFAGRIKSNEYQGQTFYLF